MGVTDPRDLPFQPVDLPHDWLIHNTLDLYENSIGWYRREWEFRGDADQVLLYFEGVYMDSTLYVNGQKVGEWKYGYSSFEHDLTPALQLGKNEILLKVVHQSPNSRWYSGAGIYRNVWLKKRGKNHIVTDGVYISTKRTDDGWQLLVDTELSLAEESQLTHTLIEIGGMALSRLLVTAFTIVRGRIMVAVGARLGQDLRSMTFGRLQALSLSFIDQHRTGDLMNRINRDTDHVQSFLQHQMPDVITQALLLVGIIIILLMQNWKLALMILIPAPFIVWLSNATRRRVRRMYHQQWRWWDEANSSLQDILSGIRVVKAFGNEKREAARFAEDSGRLRDITARNEAAWNTLYPTLSFIMGLGNFLILYYGGTLVLDQTFQIGELIQFSAYAGLVYGPLQFMSFIPRWFHQAMTAAERLFEILDEVPEIQDKPQAIALPELKGEIQLEDVTFGYRSHEPVLRRVNLHIQPGEMIGLVGHSGAGKSTLINLINRFMTWIGAAFTLTASM